MTEELMRYIGTKIIKAKPMSYGIWIRHKSNGNESISEGDNKDGYFVEYEDGYQSWSPKDVFEKHYKHCADVDSEASIMLANHLVELFQLNCLGSSLFVENSSGRKFEVIIKPDVERYRKPLDVTQDILECDVTPSYKF